MNADPRHHRVSFPAGKFPKSCLGEPFSDLVRAPGMTGGMRAHPLGEKPILTRFFSLLKRSGRLPFTSRTIPHTLDEQQIFTMIPNRIQDYSYTRSGTGSVRVMRHLPVFPSTTISGYNC
jgi:hypothetical protein